jgi:hypothetical protein
MNVSVLTSHNINVRKYSGMTVHFAFPSKNLYYFVHLS